jgi:hypothetical protein
VTMGERDSSLREGRGFWQHPADIKAAPTRLRRTVRPELRGGNEPPLLLILGA